MYVIHRTGRRTDLRLRRWAEGDGAGGDESMFPIDEVEFIVGAIGRPQEGDSIFVLKDCDGLPVLNRQVKMEREHEPQEEGDIEFGFTYNPLNGYVTVKPKLWSKERIKFYIYKAGTFATCEDVGNGLLMINNNDSLMINSIDKFIL